MRTYQDSTNTHTHYTPERNNTTAVLQYRHQREGMRTYQHSKKHIHKSESEHFSSTSIETPKRGHGDISALHQV